MQMSTMSQQLSTQQSRLTGTVTDEDGEPLRGLHVKAVHGETVVAWAETDCNGHYEMGLPPGTYEVRFCSLAYHEVVDPHVAVAGPCTNVDAVLVPMI
jgi:hypothetical protein